MSPFWLIAVVTLIVVIGAIFVSKSIRRAANDEALFDDDHDQTPAGDAFNSKRLLVLIPVVALVIWAVLSLTAEYYYVDPYGRSASERAKDAQIREEYGLPNPTAECRKLVERGEKMLPNNCVWMD